MSLSTITSSESSSLLNAAAASSNKRQPSIAAAAGSRNMGHSDIPDDLTDEIFDKLRSLQVDIQKLKVSAEQHASTQSAETWTELDFDKLTEAQLVKIFGPKGPSRHFDKFVEMKDPKTERITKHKIQDWASLPSSMIQSTDPRYEDYDTCKMEFVKAEFLRRRGMGPASPSAASNDDQHTS